MQQSQFHIQLPDRRAARQVHNRRRRGQSTVEMALSMVVLTFLFQGVFDLGRAYYALVMLNNAVSEGAHWAASFPICLNSAADSTAFHDNLQPTQQCDGNNSIVGRIVNEEKTLDQSAFQQVCWSTADASSAVDNLYNTSQNTVALQVVYKFTFVTPVIQGLFGNTIPLSAEVKEVIRGKTSDLPQTPVYSGAGYQGGVQSSYCLAP